MEGGGVEGGDGRGMSLGEGGGVYDSEKNSRRCIVYGVLY